MLCFTGFLHSDIKINQNTVDMLIVNVRYMMVVAGVEITVANH
jgi:hypothetical protein